MHTEIPAAVTRPLGRRRRPDTHLCRAAAGGPALPARLVAVLSPAQPIVLHPQHHLLLAAEAEIQRVLLRPHGRGVAAAVRACTRAPPAPPASVSEAVDHLAWRRTDSHRQV
jgi:hypothetical protein